MPQHYCPVSNLSKLIKSLDPTKKMIMRRRVLQAIRAAREESVNYYDRNNDDDTNNTNTSPPPPLDHVSTKKHVDEIPFLVW